MGRYTKNAISLAKCGLRKIGDDPTRFKKKALVQIGIGIMSALAVGVFAKSLLN